MEAYVREVHRRDRTSSGWYKHVETSWWAEMCVPNALFDICPTAERPDQEAQVFWRQLCEPDQDEARDFVTDCEIGSLQAAEERADFAAVARRCCLVELEEKILRVFGVSARVLPELGLHTSTYLRPDV